MDKVSNCLLNTCPFIYRLVLLFHLSLKKLLFVADGDYFREARLVKVQKMSVRGVPSPDGTSIAQPLYSWLSEHGEPEDQEDVTEMSHP